MVIPTCKGFFPGVGHPRGAHSRRTRRTSKRWPRSWPRTQTGRGSGRFFGGAVELAAFWPACLFFVGGGGAGWGEETAGPFHAKRGEDFKECAFEPGCCWSFLLLKGDWLQKGGPRQVFFCLRTSCCLEEEGPFRVCSCRLGCPPPMPWFQR